MLLTPSVTLVSPQSSWPCNFSGGRQKILPLDYDLNYKRTGRDQGHARYLKSSEMVRDNKYIFCHQSCLIHAQQWQVNAAKEYANCIYFSFLHEAGAK